MFYNSGIKRTLCCVLSIFLMLTVFYVPTEAKSENKRISVINFNNESAVAETGAKVVRKNTADGNKYSALWDNHMTNGDFWIKNPNRAAPENWLNFTTMEMQIYSQKRTDATIMVICYSPDTEASRGNYFGTTFKVDWEGWKTIKIDLRSMDTYRAGTWKNINQLRMVSNGNWNITGSPETALYVASMEIYAEEPNFVFLDEFYSDETVEKALEYMKGSAAVYAGGEFIVTSSGAKKAKYDVEFMNETVMVPLEFFKDNFGAKITQDGTKYSITLNQTTVTGKADSSSVTCGINTQKLRSNTCFVNGMYYVDGEILAKLLGLSAFTDGKLLVAGREATVDALKRKQNLGVNQFNEVISQLATCSAPDFSIYTPEDTAAVKANWKRTIVGNEATNDMTDPDIAKMIKTFEKDAEQVRKNLIRNPEAELFSDTKSDKSGAMSNDYAKVYKMAKAYSAYGSKYYKDKALLDDILFALDWLKDNRYSNEGRALWKFDGFNNWYDWIIGAPSNLIPTLICIEDSLTDEQVKLYTQYFNEQNAKPTGTGSNFCNQTVCIIGSALLNENYEQLIDVQTDFQKMYLFADDNTRLSDFSLKKRGIEVEPKNSGFHTDGSYIFHTLHAMNGSYGPEHFEALTFFEILFNDTVFEIKSPLRENVPKIFFEGFEPLIFGTTMYRHVLGRNVSITNFTHPINILCNMFEAAECFDEDVKNKIYSTVKAAYLSSDEVHGSFISNLNVDSIAKFKAVMEDPNIKAKEDMTQSKIYYNMDKSVHARNDWAVGVSMSSSRIFNYESINSNNMNGWYLGDGRTEYYNYGDSTNAVAAYWANINPYRLPGTTVDTQERQTVSIAQGNEYLSSKDFVGGAALGGKYSAMAMELESYHNEEDFGNNAGDYGGKAPAHKNDLTAKKGYFMLDDGFLCLGTGINAKNNNNAEVLTIVENRLATKLYDLNENKEDPKAYPVSAVVASHTPEAENTAENTIDGSVLTKWAGKMNNSITWDLGEEKTLGFASISLQNGHKRQQHLEIQVSSDGEIWQSMFDGSSSGKKDVDEAFDLKGVKARYVKYINKGNSNNSEWVSITECGIYPPNDDGTIGVNEPLMYGDNDFFADGKAVRMLDKEADLSKISWANLDNKCGYYFPKTNSDNLGNVKARWTKGNASYFEMWFSHGVNPTNSQYAYFVLPNFTAEETKAFAEKNQVKILSNTNKLQAVRDERTNVTYMIFWEAGSFENITVDKPCIVVTKAENNKFDISVSDPTQKQKELTVTLNQKYSAVTLDDCAEVTTAADTTIITLDTDNSHGRSFECELEKEKPENLTKTFEWFKNFHF